MKDAYYFSHDSNAKDDPKCMLLIEQLGLEGYGIFWILVELLRDQPDYRYQLSLLPAIARKFNTTTQKVETVVKAYDLFKITEDGCFFSISLVNRMKYLEVARLKKSNAGKKGNKVRWIGHNVITELSQCDSTAITTQSQNIASKVKESKVNEIKHSIVNKSIENLSDDAIKLCKYYEELKPGQTITQHIGEINIFIQDYKFEWCKEALQKTVFGTGKFVPNYMSKILKGWQLDGKPEFIKMNKPKGKFNDFEQRSDAVEKYEELIAAKEAENVYLGPPDMSQYHNKK